MPLERKQLNDHSIGWISNVDSSLQIAGALVLLLLVADALLRQVEARAKDSEQGRHLAQIQLAEAIKDKDAANTSRTAAEAQVSLSNQQADDAREQARLANQSAEKSQEAAKVAVAESAKSETRRGEMEAQRSKSDFEKSAAEDKQRAAEEKYRAAMLIEQGLRQELLGLRSTAERMENVVFVVDRSYSMEQPPGSRLMKTSKQEQTSSRWKYVKSTVKTWMELLPCKNVSLVTFHSEVEAHPQTGLLPVNKTNIDELMAKWDKMDTASGTNTLGGIQFALQVPTVDAIVLFTDGEPNTSEVEPPPVAAGESSFDRYQVQILVAVEKHVKERTEAKLKPIPINVIALGDYHDGHLGPFLVKLAETTGGTFVGR